jgi:murein DD-endopeptidase MepM/ murein hydrolase activator NlpD
MKPGSIPVKVGDRVVAGQQIGLVGNSGVAQVPHIHFNLMNGPKWLEAKGIPSLFDDFERLRTGGAPLELERGNPMTGWIVRPLERD